MKKVILAMSVILGICTAAFAETVYLHNGQVFRGTIITEKFDYVIIRTDAGYEERIDANYIRSISRDEPVRYESRRSSRQADYVRTDSELAMKFGVDFTGSHETTNGVLYQEGAGNTTIDNKHNVDAGLSFSGEYVSYLSNNIGLGGGITFQSYRSLKDVPGQFSFTPLYGIMKFRTDPVDGAFYSYLVGHLGYNLFNGDIMYSGENGELNGGLYWGAGAGMSLNRWQIELLYTEHNGTAKDSGYIYNEDTAAYDYFSVRGDIKYSKLGLSIGYKF